MATLKALLVGVTEYAFKLEVGQALVSKDMQSAQDDVGNMRDLIEELTIKSSTESPTPARPFARAYVRQQTGYRKTTRDQILQGLGWLFRDPVPDQQLLFYFSGHGLQAPNADDPNTLEEVLCPSDVDWRTGANALRDADLVDIGRDRLAGGGCIEIVLESCFSAGVGAAFGGGQQPVTRFGCMFGGNQFPGGAGVVWAACGAAENSHSGPVPVPCEPGPVRGLFTQFFCDFAKTPPAQARRWVLTEVTKKLGAYRAAAKGCCTKPENEMKQQTPELIRRAPAGAADPANSPPLRPMLGGCPVVPPQPAAVGRVETTVEVETVGTTHSGSGAGAATVAAAAGAFKKTSSLCDSVVPLKG